MIKMNKIILIASLMLLTSNCFAAGGSDGSADGGKASLYKEAKKLVLRAKKLEKKDKAEKALKLYSKAYDKLIKAYKKDKKNADILNYLGFTLRKSGNFEEGPPHGGGLLVSGERYHEKSPPTCLLLEWQAVVRVCHAFLLPPCS